MKHKARIRRQRRLARVALKRRNNPFAMLGRTAIISTYSFGILIAGLAKASATLERFADADAASRMVEVGARIQIERPSND